MPSSILDTDGYKFSMAEAGYPLRRETFVYTHRKGGWQFLPVDVEAHVRALLPVASADDYAWLDTHGYFQGGAFRQAVTRHDEITVDAMPMGSWFFDREIVFSVTGPSSLVSWLEPLVLQLHYRIQVATAALLGRLPAGPHRFTCARERDLFLESVETARAHGAEVPAFTTEIASDAYHAAVLERTKRLVAVVGDPNRLFEVGMRAASCVEQHEIALRAHREAGILRTSNVGLARKLDLVPVGTMGHEHVQRHGSDLAACCAMRDKFPGFIFYLPDTFDTLASGIPSALAAMQEDPGRNSGIRFDSEHGIVGHYLFAVSRAREAGLSPLLGLESGWDEALTVKFEELRRLMDWPADRQAYGYGGYLVNPPWPSFRRDDVSAVWKISQTGSRATMKFGDEPMGGKSSIPGRPVMWRPLTSGASGPVGIVAQADETWVPPVPALRVTGAPEGPRFPLAQVRSWTSGPLQLSPGTQAVIARCVADRDRGIAEAVVRRSG